MLDLAALKSQGFLVNPEAISNMDESEEQSFLERLKTAFFQPGQRVRISQEDVGRALDAASRRGEENKTLESLRNAKDTHFEVEAVYYKNSLDAGYKLKGSDLLIWGGYITDARPTKHMFGLVLDYKDRVFAVQLDGVSEQPVVLGVYEILGGVEPAFGCMFGANTVDELKAALAVDDFCKTHPAVSGEFTLADTGGMMEVWCLGAISWASGVSDKEIEVASEAIEEHLRAVPTLN